MSIVCNLKRLCSYSILSRLISIDKFYTMFTTAQSMGIFFFRIFEELPLDSHVQSLDQSLVVAMRSHIGGNPSSDGETEQVKIAK